MSDSLEQQQFKKWLRRPTLFIANGWYLLASSGQYLSAVMLAMASAVLGVLGISVSESGLSSFFSAVYEIGFLALPVIIYAARHDGVGQSMRLNPPRFGTMLAASISAVAAIRMANYLTFWWMLLIQTLGGRLYPSNIDVPSNISELTSAILLVGVLPGICEELFFRGGLMGAWERRGTKLALVVTSALFAMLHGSIFGLPIQLIMGFVLGYVLILSDSLYVSMIYHTVYNSASLFFSYISQLTPVETVIDPYVDMAGYIASTGGFFLLFVQTLIMTAALACSLIFLTTIEMRHGRQIEKITRGDESKMTWQELLVLLSGLLTVGSMYFSDILTVCGII